MGAPVPSPVSPSRRHQLTSFEKLSSAGRLGCLQLQLATVTWRVQKVGLNWFEPGGAEHLRQGCPTMMRLLPRCSRPSRFSFIDKPAPAWLRSVRSLNWLHGEILPPYRCFLGSTSFAFFCWHIIYHINDQQAPHGMWMRSDKLFKVALICIEMHWVALNCIKLHWVASRCVELH